MRGEIYRKKIQDYEMRRREKKREKTNRKGEKSIGKIEAVETIRKN
jgi:hypothetical protein